MRLTSRVFVGNVEFGRACGHGTQAGRVPRLHASRRNLSDGRAGPGPSEERAVKSSYRYPAHTMMRSLMARGDVAVLGVGELMLVYYIQLFIVT